MLISQTALFDNHQKDAAVCIRHDVSALPLTRLPIPAVQCVQTTMHTFVTYNSLETSVSYQCLTLP